MNNLAFVAARHVKSSGGIIPYMDGLDRQVPLDRVCFFVDLEPLIAYHFFTLLALCLWFDP